MPNKMPSTSPDPTLGNGPTASTVTPPASVVQAAAAQQNTQLVEPGPDRVIRGPDGKFAKAAPAAPAAPGVRTQPADSPEVLAAREKLYDIWPEKAIETWGPRPEKPAAPEAAAAAKKEQPKAQDAPKAEPAEQGTVARDKAVKALKLDGFTDDDLAAMKPERVQALGQASIARHAAVDARLAGNAGDRKQQTADGAPAESVETRQLPPEVQAAVKELADEIGSDKAGKVLEQLFARYEAREQSRELERIDAELGSARTALRESLPGLADEGVWSKVIDEMVDLRNTKRYGSMPFADVIPVAYANVVPPPTPQETAADRLQTDGLPTAPPSLAPKAPRSGVKKGDDPYRVIYDALAEGMTKEEAAQLGRVALGR